MKSDWQQDMLSDRVYDYIGHLLKYLEAGTLPQYFYPRNNLLDGKNDIADDVRVIKEFLRNPPQLRIRSA